MTHYFQRIIKIKSPLYTPHETTNPKRPDTGHTHGDFDAVQTMMLCDDVVDDNDKAPRPELSKTPICTVHLCLVHRFTEKTVDFRRNLV